MEFGEDIRSLVVFSPVKLQAGAEEDLCHSTNWGEREQIGDTLRIRFCGLDSPPPSALEGLFPNLINRC